MTGYRLLGAFWLAIGATVGGAAVILARLPVDDAIPIAMPYAAVPVPNAPVLAAPALPRMPAIPPLPFLVVAPADLAGRVPSVPRIADPPGVPMPANPVRVALPVLLPVPFTPPVASPVPTPRQAARPLPPLDTRCLGIVLRGQLGVAMTPAELALLRAGCPNP